MITIKHAAMLSSVALSAFALPAMAQNAAALRPPTPPAWARSS
jgi:hypothetical protein